MTNQELITMRLQFGQRFREARLSQGLTQEQLGYTLNMDPSTVCRIERKGTNPHLSSLIDWSNRLGINITLLLP